MVETNNNADWGSDDEELTTNCALKDKIEVEITPCEDVESGTKDVDVMVKINVPIHSAARRAPVDVVCCIDISGSMSNIASYEDPKTGMMKNDGLNFEPRYNSETNVL